jgi:hypothetical protein
LEFIVKRHLSLLVLAFALFGLLVSAPRAADTLPDRYTDAEFWRMVTEFSEPNGDFPYENFVSNESTYQVALPELQQRIKPGGVYLGVAPEQNFTYVAAIRPKVAFILDIRRQNMVELLVYKALFEMSEDRASFVTRLFSRTCPATVTTSSTPQALFTACYASAADDKLRAETLQTIKDLLLRKHQFKLTSEDVQKVELVFNVFFRGGPRMDYSFASVTPTNSAPSYYTLMTSTDGRGQNWAYLANEENYRRVREMQQKNLIVPIVGDFGGPRAIKAVARYLKEHGATVSVFYVSNVEDYLQSNWASYRDNIAALPVDDSSVFMRFTTAPNTFLRSMKEGLPSTWPGRSW